jgi:hypothetical protein
MKENIKTIQINGEFIKFHESGGIGNSFLKYTILEDETIKQAINRRTVVGVSIEGELINIVTM